MTALNVVPIRGGAPSLKDISGWLRKAADDVDSCAEAAIVTMLLVTIDADGVVSSKCFGDNPSRAEVVGLFQMAAIKTATGGWE